MLERLNENEQRALLELLVYMAKADGRIMDVEREVLHQYADLVHVDFGELQGDYDAEELISQFESPASRIIALAEIIRLSHLDGRFSDLEKVTIIDLAAKMGVPMDYVNRIDAWVVEGLQWVMSGERLLDEADDLVAW